MSTMTVLQELKADTKPTGLLVARFSVPQDSPRVSEESDGKQEKSVLEFKEMSPEVLEKTKADVDDAQFKFAESYGAGEDRKTGPQDTNTFLQRSLREGNFTVVDPNSGVATTEIIGARRYHRMEDRSGSIAQSALMQLSPAKRALVMQRTFERLSIAAHEAKKAGGATLAVAAIKNNEITVSKSGDTRTYVVVLDAKNNIVPQREYGVKVFPDGTAAYDEKNYHESKAVWVDPILHNPGENTHDPRLRKEDVHGSYLEVQGLANHSAVHRAINDWPFRGVGLRSTPDTFTRKVDIPQGGKMVVLQFCDGAFESKGKKTKPLTPDQIAEFTAEAMQQSNDQNLSLASLTHRCGVTAREQGSSDNITCMATVGNGVLWVADGHGGIGTLGLDEDKQSDEFTSDFIQKNIGKIVEEEIANVKNKELLKQEKDTYDKCKAKTAELLDNLTISILQDMGISSSDIASDFNTFRDALLKELFIEKLDASADDNKIDNSIHHARNMARAALTDKSSNLAIQLKQLGVIYGLYQELMSENIDPYVQLSYFKAKLLEPHTVEVLHQHAGLWGWFWNLLEHLGIRTTSTGDGYLHDAKKYSNHSN